jgi:hypothetical protein
MTFILAQIFDYDVAIVLDLKKRKAHVWCSEVIEKKELQCGRHAIAPLRRFTRVKP